MEHCKSHKITLELLSELCITCLGECTCGFKIIESYYSHYVYVDKKWQKDTNKTAIACFKLSWCGSREATIAVNDWMKKGVQAAQAAHSHLKATYLPHIRAYLQHSATGVARLAEWAEDFCTVNAVHTTCTCSARSSPASDVCKGQGNLQPTVFPTICCDMASWDFWLTPPGSR